MKPTVMNAGPPGQNVANSSSNGMNIPINHEYGPQYGHQQQQPQPPYQQYAAADGGQYGSPSSHARQQQQQQPQQQQQHPQQHPQQQQQIPAHFQQGFGFEPDMDSMFPRTRLHGRLHDPFAGFGGTRKRSSLHEPQSMGTDGFSRYFDDDADFGFPQFGSMGRRRAAGDPMADEHDFFNRLPSEFRQYIPDSFGHRRAGSGQTPPQPQTQQQPQQQQQPQAQPQPQYYQNYVPTGTTPPNSAGVPLSPSKKLCDAAIQTEDPHGRADVVDGAAPHMENLNQHGLRNTVDMGVKSVLENEMHGPRSHSAPPPEQLQQQQQQHQQQQQPIPVNGKRPTPPPQQGGQPHFGTQTSPQVGGGQPFQKAYYAPHQQAHPQQKQQTPPPPQTPGGTYIRTIPIFVEGRSEPIINSHKEIPNQNSTAAPAASARAFTPQQQQQQYYQQPSHQQQQHPQQHRPTPLNTQQQQPDQQQQQSAAGLPPQTPHTLDSINKIQDIQRDVLDLMGKVENFGGTRKDKEYAYLDEMLTRNLLKLDTIDTNGKDSIRLARKEAIKCIQASINVLEAKAEENAKTARGEADETQPGPDTEEAQQKSASQSELTKEANDHAAAAEASSAEPQPADATKIQEPIPLPPPEGMSIDEHVGEPLTKVASGSSNTQKEASPAAETAAAAAATAAPEASGAESK